MNKKNYLILAIAILVALFSIYIFAEYAKYKDINDSNYQALYNKCVQNNNNIVLDNNSIISKSANECIQEGGCYYSCSSCNSPTKVYTITDFVKDYLKINNKCSSACIEICLKP
jgi:hypothetical protein